MGHELEKKGSDLSRIHFEVISKLGIKIRTTERYWNVITTIKHPILKGKELEVQEVLRNPDIIHQSRGDKNVHLFYRKQVRHYLVVVVRHLNQYEGFIITSYITDTVKEGTQIWPK